jgi:hypothetical protein
VVGGKFSSKLSAWTQDGSLQELDDLPVSVELHPVCSETQFDWVLAEAQQLEEPVIFVWCGVLIFLDYLFRFGGFPVFGLFG